MVTQRKNLLAVRGLSEQKVDKIIAVCERATNTTIGAFKTGKLPLQPELAARPLLAVVLFATYSHRPLPHISTQPSESESNANKSFDSQQVARPSTNC